MSSKKQQLIQLHQLLAHIRIHAKEEWGLPTEIKNLRNYRKVGITSIDLDAEIDVQEDAIQTLAADLATAFETDSAATEATVTAPSGPTSATTFADFAGPTEQVPARDPESTASEAEMIRVKAEPEPATAEAGYDQPRDGTDVEPPTETVVDSYTETRARAEASEQTEQPAKATAGDQADSTASDSDDTGEDVMESLSAFADEAEEVTARGDRGDATTTIPTPSPSS